MLARNCAAQYQTVPIPGCSDPLLVKGNCFSWVTWENWKDFFNILLVYLQKNSIDSMALSSFRIAVTFLQHK